jgi:hypothetical protein
MPTFKNSLGSKVANNGADSKQGLPPTTGVSGRILRLYSIQASGGSNISGRGSGGSNGCITITATPNVIGAVGSPPGTNINGLSFSLFDTNAALNNRNKSLTYFISGAQITGKKAFTIDAEEPGEQLKIVVAGTTFTDTDTMSEYTFTTCP